MENLMVILMVISRSQANFDFSDKDICLTTKEVAQISSLTFLKDRYESSLLVRKIPLKVSVMVLIN